MAALAEGYEVFSLPYKGGYLIYAPLAGKLIHANADFTSRLRSFLRTGDASVMDEETARRLGGLEWIHKVIQPAPLPKQHPFAPSSATLFLTNRCNLRCVYCYAEAGEAAPYDMKREIYQAAIDLVARNAQKAGRTLQVGFHGGGEPTVAWETLTGAVDYARQTAQGAGLRTHFGIATNGVMSGDKARYIAANFPTVTLSLDGPPAIQNRQRPRLSGMASFDDVMAFIRTLHEYKTALVIRSTVTAETVHRLADFVDFFAAETGCQILHFEPVFARGRARDAATGFPSPDAFATSFVRALERADARGIRLRYSAARIFGVYSSFCGCAQDAFNVTLDGDVTGCFEVCDRRNPMAETFFFGRFDPSEQTFTFNHERLQKLRALTVENKPYCARCFAKWNCSGDCPVKGAGPGVNFYGASARCRMNQAITQALLVRALEGKACAM